MLKLIDSMKNEVERYNRFDGGHGVLKVMALTLIRIVIFPITLPLRLYRWVYYSEN